MEYHVAPYRAEYEQAVAQAEQRYQEALEQADSAFRDYIAPYLEARNQAYQYWQEHPEDDEAWQAYLQAEQAYQDALAEAEAARQAAYAQAEYELDQDLETAGNAFMQATQQYYDDYYAALEEASAAWNTAFQEAVSRCDRTIEQAGQIYLQAEAEAWESYISRLSDINEQLEVRRQELQGELDEILEEAENNWHAAESAAWARYQNALAQMLQQPPERPRAQPLDSNRPDALRNPNLPQGQREQRQVAPKPTEIPLNMQRLYDNWSEAVVNRLKKLPFPPPARQEKNLNRWGEWAKKLRSRYGQGSALVLDALLYLGLARAQNWLNQVGVLYVSGRFQPNGEYQITDVRGGVLGGRTSAELQIPDPIIRFLADRIGAVHYTKLAADLRIEVEALQLGQNGQWASGKVKYTLDLQHPFGKQTVIATHSFRIDVVKDDNGQYYIQPELGDDYNFGRASSENNSR